jgi:YVTN family beta-propeller protein
MRGRHNAQDVISGNTITGNQYAVDVQADVLPQFDAAVNNLATNVTDTLLLHGGTLSVSDTLPQLGFRWRVTQGVVVDSGATFTVLAGDTVVFDDLASLTIGGGAPSAFHAAGSAGAPILFTVTPGGDHWLGLEFANLLPSIVSNLIVEKAGGSTPCFGDCLPILFGAIRYSNVSTNGLTLDAVTVRQSRFMALDVKAAAASPLLVQNSQFYQNFASPMITSPNPLLLAIHGSDLYHYNGQIIQTANAGTDSIDALGNWWGDVGGLERGFQASDSAGMGTLSFNAVKFDNVVPGPHFPVGPAAQLVPATDTVLPFAAMNAIVGHPDSIRARVLDAQSRGVAGVAIGWGTSSGVFNDPGTPTDAGGRAAGVWQTTNAANLQFVQATVPGLIGSPVTFTAFIQPGLTVAPDFQLDPTLTQGSVSADHKTVAFSSSGHHGVFVSNAHDTFGNVTHPNTTPDFCFDDVPATGFCHNQFWYAPQYGIIDSVKADSVFFTVTTTSPAQFQIRAQYDGATGVIADSILINMNAVAAGVRIIDPSFNTPADTALYNSLCPVGGPYNGACRRTFMAQLVDSGGAALPPDPAYQFSWTSLPGGPTISDSSYGTMNEFAAVTAHQNGTASMLVQQIAGPALNPDRDTLAISVNQVVGNVAVTPDTISAGLGDTVTFTASATDQGGGPMPGAIGWRQDAPAGQYLTIIDYPTTNSIRVRIDSGYPQGLRDLAVITAFTERAPGDTIFAAGVIYNPTIKTVTGLGSQPWTVGIDPRTNLAYVGNSGSAQVAVVDAKNGVPVRFVDVGVNPQRVTVDSRNARVYVTNVSSNSISVLDGSNTGQLLSTITIGPSPGFVAVDTSSNLAYTPVACADPPNCTRGGSYLQTIDGNTRAVVLTDSVALPANGTGVAFDAGNRLVYVAMVNDTVALVDPALKKVVGLIPVGNQPQGMAINPLTRKLYVANMGDQTVSVIDLSTNTLLKNEFVTSNQPQRVAVDPIVNRVYVAGYGNFLVDRIDGNTDTTIGYMSVNCYANDVAVNAQNRDLFIPCWSNPEQLLIYRYLTH